MQLRRRSSGFQAIILRKIANGYRFVTKIDLDPEKEKFEYKDYTFIINFEDNAFTNKDGKTIIFYELNGNQLSFLKITHALSSSELDDYLTKKIIGQLVAKLKETLGGGSKGFIIYCVIGIVIGVCIGIIVGQQAFPREVTRYLIQNQTGTYPVVPLP